MINSGCMQNLFPVHGSAIIGSDNGDTYRDIRLVMTQPQIKLVCLDCRSQSFEGEKRKKQFEFSLPFFPRNATPSRIETKPRKAGNARYR